MYEAIEFNYGSANGYLIIVGKIHNYWAPANLFITLAEWREQQIKIVLDD